jgi:nitroreductase
MAKLNLSADEVLTTTRAVRKRLDFDRPVDMSVIMECLEIATQGPSGSNSQGWHFVIVRDAEKRAAIARLYQQSFAAYLVGPSQPMKRHLDNPGMAQTQQRVLSSAKYLADNLARVPAYLIPCGSGRIDGGESSHMMQAGFYGSILPAVWSFMLAARERGLGTCWTTLHLKFEEEVADILSIPFESVTQTALIPIAYTKGTDFNPAPRKPLDDIVHFDEW